MANVSTTVFSGTRGGASVAKQPVGQVLAKSRKYGISARPCTLASRQIVLRKFTVAVPMFFGGQHGQGRPLVLLLSEGRMSDEKGVAPMLEALPPAKCRRS